MAKITSLKVKRDANTFDEYPIGAEAQNIKYTNSDGSITNIDAVIRDLEANKIPQNHAAVSDIYGLGEESKHGHVRLSDQYANDNLAGTSGIAISQKGVNTMFNKYLNFQIINGDTLFSSINTGFKSNDNEKTMELIPSYFSVSANDDGNYTLVVENDKVI